MYLHRLCSILNWFYWNLDDDFRDLQFCKIRAIYTHKALFPVCACVSLLIFGFSESALLLIINVEGVTGKRTISRMVTMA